MATVARPRGEQTTQSCQLILEDSPLLPLQGSPGSTLLLLQTLRGMYKLSVLSPKRDVFGYLMDPHCPDE